MMVVSNSAPVPCHSRFVSDPAVPEVRLLYDLYPGLLQANTSTHCRIRAPRDMRARKERGLRGLQTRKIGSERGWNADLLQHVPALVDDLEIDAAPTSGPRYTAGRGELRVVRDLELRHRIERGPQLAGEQRGQLRLRARTRLHGLDADLERQRGQRVDVLHQSAELPLHPPAAAVPRPGADQEVALARLLLGNFIAAGDLEELPLERLARGERAGGGPVRQRIDDRARQLREPLRQRPRHVLGGVLDQRWVEVPQH